MTGEICGEPRRVDIVELELLKELRMRDHVETFTEIKEAQEGDMTMVHVGKDAVGDREQSGFCGMTGSETMLG